LRDADPDEAEHAQITNLRHSDAYHALDNALNRLETTLDVLKDPPADAESIVRRARQLALISISSLKATIRRSFTGSSGAPRRLSARVAD